MPVLEDLGLEVNVLVNGSRATEYPDVEHGIADNGCDKAIPVPRTFHYIESKDDTEFSIKVTSTQGAGGQLAGPLTWQRLTWYRYFFYVALDGEKVATDYTALDRLSQTINGVKYYSGDRVSFRAFRFAKVSTVDDAGNEQVASDMKKSRRLGSISVRAYRATYTDSNKLPSFKFNAILAEGSEISLAEKALKGRAPSHGSTLTALGYSAWSILEKFRSPYSTSSTDQKVVLLLLQHERLPLMIWLDALQQEMVVPRPRSISVDSDVDQLPDEGVRRLAREYLAEKRGKRKRSVTDKAESGQVPRSQRPLKVSKKGGMVTIDLTEDD